MGRQAIAAMPLTPAFASRSGTSSAGAALTDGGCARSCTCAGCRHAPTSCSVLASTLWMTMKPFSASTASSQRERERRRRRPQAAKCCARAGLCSWYSGDQPARRPPRGCQPSGRGLPRSTTARGRRRCSASRCTAESKATGDSKASWFGGVLGASAATPSGGSTTHDGRLSAADMASALRRLTQQRQLHANKAQRVRLGLGNAAGQPAWRRDGRCY